MKNLNQLHKKGKQIEMEVLALRVCNDCYLEKPIEHGRKICKECILKRKRKKIVVLCTICNIEKEIGFYSYRKNIKENGTYICNRCLSSIKNSGENSHLYVYKYNDTFFDIVDCESKSYLLGLIAGDGGIYRTSVSLTSHKNDVESLELFRDFICKDLKINDKKNTNAKYIISFSKKISTDICNLLMISPGKKSHLIQLPEINKNLKRHFIRGLFDADGWVANEKSKSTSPECGICLTSYNMIEQIKEICIFQNIKYIYTIRNPKQASHLTAYNLKFNGANAIKFLSYLYDNSNFSLSRKHNLYKIWSYWKPGIGIEENLTTLEFKKRNQIPIGKSKLNQSQVREIRKLYETKLSYEKIARKYNVHRNTIRKIIKGITFKHII